MRKSNQIIYGFLFSIYGGCIATINFVIIENLFYRIRGWYFNCQTTALRARYNIVCFSSLVNVLMNDG